ncbi:unnamed protein product [Macrosiphum euphorbiae]|uniref:HECT domain-containing protein n=1 Tax=Macrosiphum euphorbiae TaxID=13131 RepID=A0AAV0XBZ7_9HEMI|nr:unnamed protein product [Macrosiphum euphorbiae]
MVYCKALKTPGFINSLARDFKLDSSFKLLYCTLSSFRFLPSAGFLLSIEHPPHDYSAVAAKLVPPHQNRSSVLFHVPICPNNYMKSEPIRRLMLMANEDPSIDL